MGTFYNLAYEKDSFDKGEFGIDEMSNKLTLVFCNEADADFNPLWKSTEKMTPEELAKIFLYGLQVCSYWMDTDELKKMISEHVEKNIY